MPFTKGNKLGAKKVLERPLGKGVIAFRGYEGQKEKLNAIPSWQEKMRQFVESLLAVED